MFAAVLDVDVQDAGLLEDVEFEVETFELAVGLPGLFKAIDACYLGKVPT